MLIEDKSPRKIKLDKRELPPNETKGKVTPTIGTIPIFMPIFTNAGMRTIPNVHAANTRIKASFVRE